MFVCVEPVNCLLVMRVLLLFLLSCHCNLSLTVSFAYYLVSLQVELLLWLASQNQQLEYLLTLCLAVNGHAIMHLAFCQYRRSLECWLTLTLTLLVDTTADSWTWPGGSDPVQEHDAMG